MENANLINVYRCETCGNEMVTVNRHRGVTAFVIRCRVDGCGGYGTSSMYRNSQQLKPTLEWYRPEGDELPTLDDALREHVSRGGLLLRDLAADVRAMLAERISQPTKEKP